MLKQGYGKLADVWSVGVITYALIHGHSPFRSENLQDPIVECSKSRIIFHEKYQKDISDDAKDFVAHLLQPYPEDRSTVTEALQHPWIHGREVNQYSMPPEVRAYFARAHLRRRVRIAMLANRIKEIKW